MATRKRHSPEQIVRKLMAADRLLAEGKDTAAVCRELGVSEATYHRWRNQFGGLKAEDAKRLKDLERENSALKRLLAEAELEKSALKDLSADAGPRSLPLAPCRLRQNQHLSSIGAHGQTPKRPYPTPHSAPLGQMKESETTQRRLRCHLSPPLRTLTRGGSVSGVRPGPLSIAESSPTPTCGLFRPSLDWCAALLRIDGWSR